MDFISLIGNTATILALLMIGFCWVRAIGVVKLTIRKNVGITDAQTGEAKSWITKWSHRILPVLLLGAGNYTGARTAFAVWFILTSK